MSGYRVVVWKALSFSVEFSVSVVRRIGRTCPPSSDKDAALRRERTCVGCSSELHLCLFKETLMTTVLFWTFLSFVHNPHPQEAKLGIVFQNVRTLIFYTGIRVELSFTSSFSFSFSVGAARTTDDHKCFWGLGRGSDKDGQMGRSFVQWSVMCQLRLRC